ncbi:protein kinase [Novymonas esmeraldas]|uniref:Protein kinase n=1 Tax=Novymonas esmeraldas TaxID=1808958 RepID=A0AAW0F0E1_9TRYP
MCLLVVMYTLLLFHVFLILCVCMRVDIVCMCIRLLVLSLLLDYCVHTHTHTHTHMQQLNEQESVQPLVPERDSLTSPRTHTHSSKQTTTHIHTHTLTSTITHTHTHTHTITHTYTIPHARTHPPHRRRGTRAAVQACRAMRAAMGTRTRDAIPPSEGHFRHHYSLGEELGKGAYAVVYRCTHRETRGVYAVKVVDKSKAGPKDIDDITHEIDVMGCIGYHPNVVQMVEYFTTERHFYIVLDLLTGGMLFDRIVQMRHYSESDAAALVRNVLGGLAHIHAKGIIHRDLKPENLLLRHQQSPSMPPNSHLTDVCLADFGLAGYVPSTTCCGSPSYIAPEVINVGYYRTRKEPYDTKCDLWSMGVITYILLSGKMPFHGRTFKETFECVVNSRWSFSSDAWTSVTPAAKDFIQLCLTPDPAARPTALVLLQHHWLADEQPDVHLERSLDSLRKFNAQQKVRAAVRVFCWTQCLLGPLDWTPPFMRFLRHADPLTTVLTHQSQTDPSRVHTVDFGAALQQHRRPGWRLQDCCTCPSEKVCRHIQNVHEYLFVGKRSMDVYPFIDELRMMHEEAEDDLAVSPDSAAAQAHLARVNHIIEAACVFSEELGEVPEDALKPNLMLDGSRNTLFRALGGSRSVTKSWQDREKEEVARRIVERMRAKKVAAATTTNNNTKSPASPASPASPRARAAKAGAAGAPPSPPTSRAPATSAATRKPVSAPKAPPSSKR